MRHIDKLYERDLEELEADYSSGLISKEDYLKAYKEINQEYRWALAEEKERYLDDRFDDYD